jgi:hypothetical protein
MGTLGTFSGENRSSVGSHFTNENVVEALNNQKYSLSIITHLMPLVDFSNCEALLFRSVRAYGVSPRPRPTPNYKARNVEPEVQGVLHGSRT